MRENFKSRDFWFIQVKHTQVRDVLLLGCRRSISCLSLSTTTRPLFVIADCSLFVAPPVRACGFSRRLLKPKRARVSSVVAVRGGACTHARLWSVAPFAASLVLVLWRRSRPSKTRAQAT